MATSTKYCEYFEIDEEYFPCIDDSAINAGVDWKTTYPHETFIKLLKSVESMLARTNNRRSVWIHGAYGTGKSQCAYALKKILEVPDMELEEYWDKYEPLKKHPDLLQKLLGHKQKKIVTVHRYASGGINSTHDLLFAVQDSLKSALLQQNVVYIGENTLKDSVIAWVEEPTRKEFFNRLLQKPEYSSKFTQSTADEVLNSLRKGGNLKELMDNIFYLANKEGITALSIDTDRLIAWIKDIIDQNDIRIVLVWDEFSAYFKNNRYALDEFQKLASLCQEKPFYFIVVTHETSGLIIETDSSWKIIQDRFDFSEITLPDNIAFNLIHEALNVKYAAKDKWSKLADTLNSQLTESRKAVAGTAKITDLDVIKGIMPLHPMAALLLKNIASAFKSNQRSMFDFIKSANTDDVKSFQWFINNTGPEDDHPLLTVDLLWSFFYEKGRGNLTTDIQAILDTYPRQKDLSTKEQSVLKTVLIMQAIDQRLGGTVDLFKTTDRNLSYAFEGIRDLEGSAAVNLAKKLVSDGILYKKPIGSGQEVFAAAAMAGDQTKIDNIKKELRESAKTAKLVTEGGLATVLTLTPALRLRYEISPNTGAIRTASIDDFTRTINDLRDKGDSWKFNAVIAFAKDDAEAASFRKMVKEAVRDESYKNILFIDTLSTPLGKESFEQYLDFSAIAMYYNGNDNDLSRDNSKKANRILEEDWKNHIYNGQFIVYSYANQGGDKFPNGQAVLGALQDAVITRYPLSFDFTKGLNENMLKLSQGKASAKCGITQVSSGSVVGIEKHVIPTTVWKIDGYWESNPTLNISKIKARLEQEIKTAFERDGQISIREIYDILSDEYGFAPCNLSAFLAGFLLKEYACEPYRYNDSNNGHEPMSAEKLTEMLGNYIGNQNLLKYKDTYIVKMTPEEMAFYSLTEKAFKISQNQCSSAGQAAQLVATKMRQLGLPVWCLFEIDDFGVYDVIEKYTDLVQKEGKETHQKAIEIGRIAIAKPNLGDNLSALLTKENCQRGMREYLAHFESGKVIELAKKIGADSNVLEDVHRLFDVKHSCFWDKSIGEDEIRKLTVEYSVVLESSKILGVNVNSLRKCYTEWRERLKFIGISHEAAKTYTADILKLMELLYDIAVQNEILPDRQILLYDELAANNGAIRNFINNQKEIFSQIYAPYLEGLSDSDIDAVMAKLPTGMFTMTKSECNTKVKEQVELFRQGQLKTKLFTLWKEKTGEKNPREWSNRYKTPILCLVPRDVFDAAKKVFDTLNRNNPSETEIVAALEFIENAPFLSDLNDENKRNAAFEREIIGEYLPMLQKTERVRDDIDRKLSIESYEWYANPNVKQKVKELAEAEYNAGGSDKALQTIDSMDDSTLKAYLKRLVKENMTVGIEIIVNGGK
jgi:hypothetical protein